MKIPNNKKYLLYIKTAKTAGTSFELYLNQIQKVKMFVRNGNERDLEKIKENDLNISIIIPVYNEQESLKPLLRRLFDLQNEITDKTLEIIFIDDASSDKSGEIIKQIIEEH